MRHLLAALAAASIVGCTAMETTTEGTRIRKDSVVDLRPGVTTRERVIETFGEPAETGFRDGDERLYYVYREKSVPSYASGVIENQAAGAETETTLEVIIREGVVLSYSFKSTEE
jgi:outer membrane protein assembly factor BamE (lipoprotein component of BamABCDE complex)